MAKEDFVLFWGGEFSQWYPSDFTIEGVEYNCAEQYMMQQKANLFGDTKIEKRIMETTRPREQKRLGRLVKNFDVDRWEDSAFDIVVKANIAKFSQDPELLEVLKRTKGKEIVEASPEDKIWGIGLHESDERAWDKATWEGRNWLGEAIMEAREKLC
tara:strand:+ start:18557 stop:19027 length:471 start_codon:yes stop_codon:yes gene_type:complete